MSRKYKRPPLKEAACEFRFEQQSRWDLAMPGLIYEELKSSFPKRRQVKAFEGTVKATGEGLQQSVIQSERLQFANKSETVMVQVGPHVLNVSHLEPYPAWEEFRPLVQKAFSAYKKVAKPTGIQSVGLRYINEIHLPKDSLLEDFLNFYPYIGKGLPHELSTFIAGFQAPFEGERDILRVTMTRGSDDESGNTVMLDIDYFLGRVGAIDSRTWKTWLNNAHKHIETIFEGCISDKLRDQFGVS